MYLRLLLLVCVGFVPFRHSRGQIPRAKNLANYDPGSVETTISAIDFYNKQKYLMEKKLYSPNYGYEPYWDESLKPTTEDMKLQMYGTTTVRNFACGEECSYLYLRMGKICARNVSHIAYKGCWPILLIRWCYGDTHGDLSENFRTYENYCEFMDDQCLVSQNNERMVFVHMGECRPQSFYFKERYNSSVVVEDLKKFNSTADVVMKDWRDEYP